MLKRSFILLLSAASSVHNESVLDDLNSDGFPGATVGAGVGYLEVSLVKNTWNVEED